MNGIPTRRCLLLRLATLLLLNLLVSPLGASPLEQPAGRFERAPCMFKVPAAAREGRDVECGYLRVPLRHADPSGPSIRLAVAVIRSPNPRAAPDPLVMAQGGPGGSTLDAFAATLLDGTSEPAARVRATRDVVLFDQRGTYYSQPALTCPELIKLSEDTIEQRLSREENDRLSLEATLACRQRLAGEGVDLAAFNTTENAADVAALAAALGYATINFYGVSYGTLLALTLLRDHPEIVRSVIVDGVVPPQLNPNLLQGRSGDRAFGELFRACAEDAACNAAYPDLERVFFDLIERLNREPARAPVTDKETGRRYNAVLDGDTLLGLTYQMLYVSEVLGALPRAIYDARDGRYALYAQLWPIFAFDRTMSNGMFYSVECQEEANFTLDELPLEGVRPVLAEDARRSDRQFLETCANWGVPPVGAAFHAPVASDVPALVFSGEFDPITPPPFGAAAAQTLSRSYSFTFPTIGHGAFMRGDCPTAIALAFLSNPSARPDGSCLEASPRLAFITPDKVAAFPTERLLRALNGDPEATRLPASSLLLLLSLPLVWPVGALVRVARGRPGERDRLARLAPWLAAFDALLGLALIVTLLTIVIRTSLSGQEILLTFGIPAEDRGVLFIPPLIALLALATLACAVLAWRRGYWSVPARLYYTLVALAAVAFTVSLGQLGLLPAVG